MVTMKIQCDACENAVAAVMCCADEAALCVDCDKRVHAANRLANKHQRVPLLAQPKEGSKCDICQVGRLCLGTQRKVGPGALLLVELRRGAETGCVHGKV